MQYRTPELQRVLKAVGGCGALSRVLGVNLSAVAHWQNVPAHRLPLLEALTGIPGPEMRPDLYPPGKAQDEKALAAWCRKMKSPK